MLPFCYCLGDESSLFPGGGFQACLQQLCGAAEAMENQSPCCFLAAASICFMSPCPGCFWKKRNTLFWRSTLSIVRGVWFYAIVSLLTTLLVYVSLRIDPILALAATIGVSAYFHY
jgi:hypothetical protein